MWSIGAILELDDRLKLEIFIRENVDLDLPVIAEDSGHTIFEYFVSDSGLLFANFLLSFSYFFCNCFEAFHGSLYRILF